MKNKISDLLLRKLSIRGIVTAWMVGASLVGVVYASTTSNFTQTINAGTDAVDIVDTTSSYATVASPTVAFGAVDFSFGCRTGANRTSGTLGSTTQAINIQHPSGTDDTLSVTFAASATTDVWDSAGTDYDFNDGGGSGCTDTGGEAGDSVGGQMTVNPQAGTLATGQSGAATTGLSKGSADQAFVEGSTDSVTLVSGNPSADTGDWILTGVTVKNTVPASQPAAADYDINMVLTYGAS